MALYEIETLYQKNSSLGKINLIFSKLLGRPKHQCYLRSKKCGRKTDIPYWITIVVSNTFFSHRDFSNPRVPRYHGESLRSPPRKYLMQRIPEIAEVDVSDPEDLIDEGDGLPIFLVIFWVLTRWKMKQWWLWAMVGWYGSFLSGNFDVQTWSNLPTTAEVAILGYFCVWVLTYT